MSSCVADEEQRRVRLDSEDLLGHDVYSPAVGCRSRGHSNQQPQYRRPGVKPILLAAMTILAADHRTPRVPVFQDSATSRSAATKRCPCSVNAPVSSILL